MLGTRWRLGERITIGHDPTVRSAIAPPRSSDGRLRQSRLGGRSWLDSQNKWTTHRGQVTTYRLVPDDPDDPSVRGVAVDLAYKIVHPQTGDSELHFRWNPIAPSAPYQMLVHRWERAGSRRLRTLVSDGLKLFSERNPGGAPIGPRYSSQEFRVKL